MAISGEISHVAVNFYKGVNIYKKSVSEWIVLPYELINGSVSVDLKTKFEITRINIGTSDMKRKWIDRGFNEL